MQLLLVLFSALAVVSAAPGRIVGGGPVDIEKVPYQLNMELNQGFAWTHICGASIIGDNVVLTAAHCVEGSIANLVRFRSGADKTQEGFLHHAKNIHVHPDFVNSENGTDYDVAVVVVKENFEMSATTQPIALATVEPAAGDEATVSGWGLLQEGGLFPPAKLQSVVVPIVDRAECQAQYSEVAEISDRMICAGLPEGGKDSCQGDSGGPLVANGALSGIVSFGLGCARPGYPGIYTNVAALVEWINQQVALARV